MNTVNGSTSLSLRSQEIYNILKEKFKKFGTVEERLPIILEDKETLSRFLQANEGIKESELRELYEVLGEPEGVWIVLNVNKIIGSLISHSGVNPLLEDSKIAHIAQFHSK